MTLDLRAFAQAVEAVTDTAFVALDAEGVVRSWNAGAAALSGMSPEAAIGQLLSRVLETPDGTFLDLRALADRPGAPSETEIHNVFGTRVRVLVTLQRAAEGYLLQCRRAQPASPAAPLSAELQALLLTVIRDMVVMTDLQGIVTYWNEGATTLLGYRPEERLGQPLFMNLADDRRALMQRLMASLAAGGEWEDEYEATHKDGSKVWLATRARALVDVEGRMTGLLAIGHDIRPRKAAERALAEREADYRATIETSGDGYWVTDLEGRILEANDAYARLSGYTRAELLDLRISDVEQLESHEDVLRRVERIRRAGTDRFETLHVRKDGTVWPVEVTVATLPESGRFYVFLRDITERRRAETELRQSEARLAAAQDAARLGSWWWEPATDRVWWSDAIRAQFGVSPDALPSHDLFLSLLHPDDLPLAEANVAAVLDGGDGYATDLRVVARDGSVRWIDSRGRAIRDDVGTLLRVEGTVQDITERKRTEEALRESEERFRSVLDGSPAVIFLKDLEGRYTFVNQAFARLAGRRPEELIAQTSHAIAPPDTAGTFDRAHERVLATRRPIQAQEDVTLPDGTSATFLSLRFPLFRADGQPYAVCGISTDITAWRRAQTERDQLWNQSPDPLCIAGVDGRLQQVNPAWTARLGWTEAELLDQSWIDFVHPDDRDHAREVQATLLRGEAAQVFENRCRTRDGDWRWFSWIVVPLPEQRQFRGFIRDITEEKRLGEQLQQSQKIEAIGRLAGGVAHDFNNLLTIINGHALLLLGAPGVQPDQREKLQAIHDAGDRAAALTAQLLAFGRKAMVEPRILDINTVAMSATRMLGRLIGEDIRLITDLASSLPPVRIDPSQLDQVLVNLVVNARDAMPTGGVLRIATSSHVLAGGGRGTVAEVPAGTYVRLTVADTGAGMPDAVKAHIFEPFYTTKGVGQGTGLGLATVYGIVRQAGGTVTVDSAVDAGTSFHVLLPAVDHAEVVAQSGAAALPAPRGKETLLVVEDEPGVRQLTRLVLQAQGYTVHEAASPRAAEAFAQSSSEHIDLLITDVVMPGVSGHQLASSLRAGRPGLRVLYMSGYTDDAVLRRGVETATDAFLQKPFTPLVLARKVRDVLDA
jgi:PAS domain S-box-containing protein